MFSARLPGALPHKKFKDFKANISHFLWVDSRNFLTALVLQDGGPILFGE